MPRKPEDLYLDLMKKTLSFLLWPEPPLPIDSTNFNRSRLKRSSIALLTRLLDPMKLRLVTIRSYSDEQRAEGKVWPYPAYADTMIGVKRLDNLQQCVQKVLEDRIEGDFIETGVWRVWSCIFMRAILAAYGIEDRKIFVADSFEG